METANITSQQKKYAKLYKESRKLIPSGTQTYSKSANRYVEGIYPYFIESGNGPFVYDADGNQYIDYPCALGAVILGYANPYVNEEIIRRIKLGTLFSMPSTLEMELAKVINRLIPSMESMRFLKSGSEAVSAAVKIARSYTKRDVVLSSGYHGWHDWSTPITNANSGTPEICGESVFNLKYGDLEDLKSLLTCYDVAAVVIDPIVFDEPPPDYLEKVISLSHKSGALVIFDEVVTGIRWHNWSVQGTYGVTPDITCLGKTLGNGVPISCVGGRSNIMAELNRDCFVSSTYGGDLIGITAALATLKVAVDNELPERLYESGSYIQDGFNEIADSLSLNARCVGLPFRQKLEFPTLTHKAVFWQECLKEGVFLGSAQHTNLAHNSVVLSKTLEVFKSALSTLRLSWDNPKNLLEGKLPEAVSTISNLRTSNGA